MKRSVSGQRIIFTILFSAAMALALSGCSQFGFNRQSEEPPTAAAQPASTEPQPYFPTEFSDLMIPSELSWNMDNTMYIKTDSFVGGVLNFTGQVDINSLADFFTTSMQNNGWKLISSAKYRKTLLAFTKPNKNCIITIAQSEFIRKADVYVYITENIATTGSFRRSSPPSSLSSEPIY